MKVAKELMVRIDTIKIGSRFRKSLGDVDSLAASIERQGLLQPIGITKSNELVFGRRRLEAFKRLGCEEIPVRLVDVPSLSEAEFDENEHRKSFTVTERVEIVEHFRSKNGIGHGGDRKRNQAQKLGLEDAVKKAGLGNVETYRQAKKVAESDCPWLIQSMDSGETSINAAFQEVERRDTASENSPAKPSPKFNRQSGDSIGWVPFTWNIGSGCEHGCDYCL